MVAQILTIMYRAGVPYQLQRFCRETELAMVESPAQSLGYLFLTRVSSFIYGSEMVWNPLNYISLL